MASADQTRLARLSRVIRRALSRLEVLALFPLLVLIAVGIGGMHIAVATATLLPLLLALQAFGTAPGASSLRRFHKYDPGALPGQDALLSALDDIAIQANQDSACFLIQIDNWDGVVDRWGGDIAQDISNRVVERLCTSFRNDDVIARLGEARFGVVLHALPAARLGTRDAVLTRLRASLGEAIAVSGGALRLTICAGHTALIRDAIDPAGATLAAAEAALAEAHREGPDTVRAYAPGLNLRRRSRNELSGEVDAALAAHDIRPWFQPQVASDTGAPSGFEALARWHHPERGVLTPGEFLPAVEDAGCMEALGHTILFHALNALHKWDAAGLRVPSVSVNFSTVELRNPRLVDRVKWEIDRFDLRPGRLTVEILETVAAETRDDTVVDTITALGAHGVSLDLDDFGIGQASLSAIRRFGVSRIKIDRSFINGLDENPEQHAMVSAILAMAQHLGVETLAEGVETAAVQTLLTQMGCNHLQGFGIARPMPFEDTLTWAAAYRDSLGTPETRDRRTG